MSCKRLRWKFAEGIPGVQAALSYADDYVISHRTEEYNVSYRPPGQHRHVGTFKTLPAAKRAAARDCKIK
jgi:hypothetical protein